VLGTGAARWRRRPPSKNQPHRPPPRRRLWRRPSRYGTFSLGPAALRSPLGIVRAAAAGDRQARVQIGILLLIATPIARVLFATLGFAAQRDWLYVAISTVVLVLLAYSLLAA